ncbi:MAG TPA: hypothetical protein VIL24_03690 [Clostridia bacterium]
MTDSQDIFILLLMVLFLANQNICCDRGDDEFGDIADENRFCNINDLIILMLILFALSGDSFCHHRRDDSDVAGVSNYNCARRNMNCRNN